MANGYMIGSFCDHDAEPCRVCGGVPIVVEYAFDVSKLKLKRRMNGKFSKVLKEKRAYYHCPCNCTVTEYARPLYSGYEIAASAREMARREWDRVNKGGNKCQ